MAEPASGWIYIAQMAGHACAKIGWTRAHRTPAERARDNTLGPVPMRIIRAWRADDARLLERLTLRRLENLRVRGEWLSATVEDIEEAVEVTAQAHGIAIEPMRK